jgi:hypothetical protein
LIWSRAEAGPAIASTPAAATTAVMATTDFVTVKLPGLGLEKRRAFS